ncbi:thioredoxin family protein [uncultured Pontibacter sp.]|uniref:thioredoxin family protein n=1 Tax=uncultured Pontibacter sp. TaxID=453356 RepID=UPI0026171CCD|nr:thioredoxin family protein [uncultured Pontibacter sp.]
MAQSTTQIELGSKAHHFALLDTISDQLVSLNDVASSKATVIMFICNHCPYVRHILPQLVQVAEEYKQKGVSFVAISSNDVQLQPQDGPEEMKMLADELQFPFPYLYDQTQMVARHYMAECTPEFFVYDGNKRLAYHGQFDNSRPNSNTPVTGQDLKQALDLLLNQMPAQEHQQPSVGCGIKWRE